MNDLVKDNDLNAEGLSFGASETSEASMVCFSLSVVELQDLKLSFGRRLLMEGLPLDEVGLGDINFLVEVGVHVLHVSALVEVEPGVGGIFILTD